jgi:rfaE bifunctional protein nucleotidyltransferase chain/domain
MPLDAAVRWRQNLARTGRALVLTNGCFDIVHRGHVQYLAHARQLGDALLVAINSDESVRANKGPGRPVVPEADRAYLVASLEAVDAVTVFSAPEALDVIRQVQPDIYAKGGDYRPETLVHEEYLLLKELNVRIEILPLAAGFSTTNIIRAVREGNPL